jgi:hypothetical protein
MASIEDRLAIIEQRNKKVEADKAWEKSFTRIGTIAVMTYGIAIIFLWLMGTPRPWLAATLPAVGFIFSTLSLSAIKQRWLRRRQ